MICGMIGLLISMGIPLLAAVFFAVRRDGTFLTFLTGIAAFVVSQVILRMPILKFLGTRWDWFMLLPYTNRVLYFVFMGITAGIFEETGRLLGFRLIRKGRESWMDGLAFGLGHGGVEAFYIGVTGILPGMIQGMAGNLAFLLSGVERLFAMMIQIGLSFLVLKGVKEKKPGCYVLAILLHGAVDFLIIFGNVWIVEGLLAAEGILALALSIRARRNWGKETEG